MIFLAVLLFPVAIYFLILGLLNRRPRPVLVPGTWDCAGLLLACSGALLLGGPALISAFYSRDVRAFLLGQRWDKVPFEDLFTFYWWIWLLYFVAVIAGCGLLIWWRWGMVSIYNIEPAVFDDLLGQILDRLGLEWTRMGDRVFIRGLPRAAAGTAPPLPPVYSAQIMAGPPDDLPAAEAVTPALPALFRPDQEAILDVEPFAATRHVSLIWRSTGGPLRAEIESAIRRSLEEVRALYNPAGNWFLIIASALFLLIFLGVAITILIDLQLRRAR